MCSKKGEKVSTPLDKDGRDLHGLITHMRQLSPTSGQPYFLIGCLICQTIKIFPDMACISSNCRLQAINVYDKNVVYNFNILLVRLSYCEHCSRRYNNIVFGCNRPGFS